MNVKDMERQAQAHSDTAREECVKHMRAAAQAFKHGEDENGLSHVLDALVMHGRAEAFHDIASDFLELLGDGE